MYLYLDPSVSGIDELLGNPTLKSLIIAYHAVPGTIYNAARLSEMGASGEDNYLDTSLARLLDQSEGVDAGAIGKGKGVSHAGASLSSPNRRLNLHKVMWCLL
jgi:hypothetical protein